MRHGFPFYSKDFERKKFREMMRPVKLLATKEEKIRYLEKKGISFWLPDEITYSDGKSRNEKIGQAK